MAAAEADNKKALLAAAQMDNEIAKKKEPSSALRAPGKAPRTGLSRRVSFADRRLTTNFDTDEEDEDNATSNKSDEVNQTIASNMSMRGKTNARSWPLDRSEQIWKHDPTAPWLESVEQREERKRRGLPASFLGHGVAAPVSPIVVSDEPVVQESYERGRPITRMTSERNRESSEGSKKPERKRRAYSPYSESMGAGTSDVNRLGPSTHAPAENVVQKYHRATAASGVITLDVRGVDTLTIKTAPGFYLRTGPSGMQAEMPAQLFYQWLGEGGETLHQEFVLHVDDARNPQQELIGTLDIPTNGEFEGYQVSNGSMSDVQSAITSARPRPARAENVATPADK